MIEKIYEIVTELDGRNIDKIFSSGLAYYICPKNHVLIQYFINMVFITKPCRDCKEIAILDSIDEFP